MAILDVSEALTDPMLLESILVIRRMETVNLLGEVTTSSVTYPTKAVVSPVGENSLLREENFQAQSKSIDVYTNFRLRGVAETINGYKYQPDIVVWHNNNFIVRTLEDLSNWGNGFVHAECSSFDLVDQPPQEQGS